MANVTIVSMQKDRERVNVEIPSLDKRVEDAPAAYKAAAYSP